MLAVSVAKQGESRTGPNDRFGCSEGQHGRKIRAESRGGTPENCQRTSLTRCRRGVVQVPAAQYQTVAKSRSGDSRGADRELRLSRGEVGGDGKVEAGHRLVIGREYADDLIALVNPALEAG